MIAVAIIFIVLGALVKYGKMYFLIAGYNTMSKEKQAEYDIDGIAAVFRNAMFGMALMIIAGYFAAQWFQNLTIELVSFFGAIIIGIPYLLIKVNSDRYRVATQERTEG